MLLPGPRLITLSRKDYNVHLTGVPAAQDMAIGVDVMILAIATGAVILRPAGELVVPTPTVNRETASQRGIVDIEQTLLPTAPGYTAPPAIIRRIPTIDFRRLGFASVRGVMASAWVSSAE